MRSTPAVNQLEATPTASAASAVIRVEDAHKYYELGEAETHAAAQQEQIALQDLAKDEWILAARRVHPVVHDAIIDAARREGIALKHAHDTIAPQEAVHLVSEHVGGAILTKPTAFGFRAEGVVVKPLSDASLCFQTCVIMRADDNSRLANEFARSFLRRYAGQRRPPKPIELALPARVVSMKKANPAPGR